MSEFVRQVDPMIKLKDVVAITGRQKSKIYSDMKIGLFPRSVRLGGAGVGWPLSEVEQINKAVLVGKTNEQIKKLVEAIHEARGGV